MKKTEQRLQQLEEQMCKVVARLWPKDKKPEGCSQDEDCTYVPEWVAFREDDCLGSIVLAFNNRKTCLQWGGTYLIAVGKNISNEIRLKLVYAEKPEVGNWYLAFNIGDTPSPMHDKENYKLCVGKDQYYYISGDKTVKYIERKYAEHYLLQRS